MLCFLLSNVHKSCDVPIESRELEINDHKEVSVYEYLHKRKLFFIAEEYHF